MTHTFAITCRSLLNRVAGLLFLLLLPVLGACSDSTPADFDSSVADAEQSLADGQPDRAAQICTRLMAEDFDKLDETQLGRMAVIFMKLPESENTDENVADATQCVRQAWKLSKDSLRGFLSGLPPEDVPHFVMLTRISGSIDFPPDLSEEKYPEDALHLSPR